MLHNTYTFLYVYFASYVLVFRLDAVFASVNVPENCVGPSCKGVALHIWKCKLERTSYVNNENQNVGFNL